MRKGRFACLGSVGTDDLTVASLHEWGEGVVAADERVRPDARLPSAQGRQAHAAQELPDCALGEWEKFDPEPGELAAGGEERASALAARDYRSNSWAERHAWQGAIAVCADGPELDGVGLETGWTAGLDPGDGADRGAGGAPCGCASIMKA